MILALLVAAGFALVVAGVHFYRRSHALASAFTITPAPEPELELPLEVELARPRRRRKPPAQRPRHDHGRPFHPKRHPRMAGK